jgi:hypothetical protein
MKNNKVPFHSEEEKRLYIDYIKCNREEKQIHVLRDTMDETIGWFWIDPNSDFCDIVEGIFRTTMFPLMFCLNGTIYTVQKISNKKELNYLNKTPVLEPEEVKNSKINIIKSLVKEMYDIFSSSEFYDIPYKIDGIVDRVSLVEDQDKYNKYVDELYDICLGIIRVSKLSKKRKEEGLAYLVERIHYLYRYVDYSISLIYNEKYKDFFDNKTCKNG